MVSQRHSLPQLSQLASPTHFRSISSPPYRQIAVQPLVWLKAVRSLHQLMQNRGPSGALHVYRDYNSWRCLVRILYSSQRQNPIHGSFISPRSCKPEFTMLGSAVKWCWCRCAGIKGSRFSKDKWFWYDAFGLVLFQELRLWIERWV